MSKKSIFLRGIDEDVYREVKLRAVLLGVSVSEIVNAALREWLKKPVIVKEKKDPSREIADSLVEKYLKEGKRGYIIVYEDLRKCWKFSSTLLYLLRMIWVGFAHRGVRRFSRLCSGLGMEYHSSSALIQW